MTTTLQRDIKTIYQDHYAALNQKIGPTSFEELNRFIASDADEIAELFYREMNRDPEARLFLSHEMVHTHLKFTLAEWIRELFVFREGKETGNFITRQLEIGHTHARISIPVHTLFAGVRLLKTIITDKLMNANLEPKHCMKMIEAVHTCMDLATSVINESYSSDLLYRERKQQSFQQNLRGQDLALKCERQRGNLFDWYRKLITDVYSITKNPDPFALMSVKKSDFGLWAFHKAPLLFPENGDVNGIQELVEEIETALARTFSEINEDQKSQVQNELRVIDEKVTKISWHLTSLIEWMFELDFARDPLTHLYNRRSLENVMQRETILSIRNATPFATLLIDLDHFKEVNDLYGHDAGDKVLRSVAEILHASIRSSDFLFRYGGEEFLALLMETQTSEVEQIAKKLLQAIREHEFFVTDEKRVRLTISIGAALHDGHPDYTRTIKNADEALYRAKHAGRNRLVIANEKS